MPTPTKYNVMVEAKKQLAQINRELGYITPEESEVKESGLYEKAKRDLMATRKPEHEQRKYAEQMASEIGMEMIPKRQWKRDLPKIQAFEEFKEKHPKFVKKTNGYTIHIPGLLKAPVSPMRLPKPKPKPLPKRIPQIVKAPIIKAKPKRHIARNGKKPRKLRGFEFGDDVWKVRKIGKR